MLKNLILYFNKIYPTYQILSGRIAKKKYVYRIFVLLISLFILIFISVPFFTDLISFNTDLEKRTNQCVNIFFLLFFDLFLILFKSKKNAILNKSQIMIYPFSKKFINIVPFLTIMIDEKIFLYFIFTLLYTVIFLFILQNILSLVIFQLLLFLLFFSLNVLSGLFLFYFNKLVTKTNIVGLLFFTAILIFNVLNITQKMHLLCSVPILGNAGNILYALLSNNYSFSVLYNFIPIFLLFFISYLFLIIKISR